MNCPVFKMENSILIIKTDRDCTYEEAKAEYETANNVGSYASKVQGRLEAARKESTKDAEIKKLRAEMEQFKAALANFESLKAAHEKLKKAYLKRISTSNQHPIDTNVNPKTPKEKLNNNSKTSTKQQKRTLDYSISPPGSPGSTPSGSKQIIIDPNMYEQLQYDIDSDDFTLDAENRMEMEQDDLNNASNNQ